MLSGRTMSVQSYEKSDEGIAAWVVARLSYLAEAVTIDLKHRQRSRQIELQLVLLLLPFFAVRVELVLVLSPELVEEEASPT